MTACCLLIGTNVAHGVKRPEFTTAFLPAAFRTALQELASRLSMKPETLSRILRHLADAGAIVVHGRLLQVPDRKRLLAMLDSAP